MRVHNRQTWVTVADASTGHVHHVNQYTGEIIGGGAVAYQ